MEYAEILSGGRCADADDCMRVELSMTESVIDMDDFLRANDMVRVYPWLSDVISILNIRHTIYLLLAEIY